MTFAEPYSDGSSSPLSSLASSPPSSPSFFTNDYPSPSSSQELSGDNLPSAGFEGPLENADGPRPAKRRRVTEPKPRTTEYLDLRPLGKGQARIDDPRLSGQQPELDLLLKVLRKKRKIVVIAGAGISVSAGIPDFRSSTGLFTTLRSEHKLKASGKHLFDASVYKNDSSTSSFHDMVRSLSHLAKASKPTAFHQLLATLAKENRLLRLYSQNVDGIDTSLQPLETKVPLNTKGPWPKTVQLHGGLGKMVCQKCNFLSDFQPELFDGPEPPLCKECEETDAVRTTIAGKRSHGIGKLRPRIVLYNEYNPDEEAIGAVTRADLRTRPDAVIVVGTSLKVPGVRRIVREMCGVVRGRRDGTSIWINNGPAPVGAEFKDCWDLVVRGDCDEVARQANFPNWDEEYTGEYQEVSDKEWARLKEAPQQAEVVIDASEKPKGVLTPLDTPQRKDKVRSQQEIEQELEQKLSKVVKGKTTSTKIVKTEKKNKPLSEILKGAKPAPKPRKKPVKKPAPAKPTTGINKAFKLTKPAIPKITKAKQPSDLTSQPKAPPPSEPELVERPTTPFKIPILSSTMQPISPSEARNNFQHSISEPPSTPPSDQSKKEKYAEIVSPKGTLPPSLAKILL